MKTGQNLKTENLKSDIVVIGGGGAGMTAAIAASEAGTNEIVVLEKAAKTGGNTALAHGIFGVNSPAQKRLGIKVSRDEVFTRQMSNSRWLVDPRLVKAFVDQSGAMIQWLEDKGMRFNTIVDEFLPGGSSFFHSVGQGFAGAVGPVIAETLIKECQKRGIKVLCETAAEEILVDNQGKVKGVLAKGQDKEIKITAKSVIIAAGGFGGNKEMLKKRFPLSEGVTGNTLPQMTGDGLVMAEKAGAFINDYYSILLIGPSYNEQVAFSLGMLLMQPEIILVNKNGERYCDESLFLNNHNYSGNSLSRQPEKKCYALLDAGIKQQIIQNKKPHSGFFKSFGGNGAWLNDLDKQLQQETTSGNIKTVGTLEEIAGFVGAEPSVLASTIQQYNSYCERGYDADFLKNRQFLFPFNTPPYYAVPGHQNFDTTLGGIRINQRMEVLDRQVKPIGGLYAAGDNAGSWLSQNYDLEHPGSALSFALSSGYIAGQNAAKYVTSRT